MLKLLFIFAAGCLCGEPVRAADPGNLDLDKMDRYIEKARQMWMVPGMAVAVIKEDSVIFAKGYGVREYGKEGRVDPNTIFSIASITKTFTSTAIAILDDEGKLDWDDRVQDYLPEFHLYDPWVSGEIRIRDLLCHRSGLSTFSGDLLWYETDYTRDQVLHRAGHLKQSFGFRYGFGYSNICYLAAGEIAGRCSGEGWEGLVSSRILEPLGMGRTSLDLAGIGDDPNAAKPHYVNILTGESTVLPYLDLENAGPAISMNSSALDLCRWIRFQMDMGTWNGAQLISMDNIWETRKLHTPQPPEMGESRIWPSRHFAGYGLGWDMYDYHGCKVIGHEGGTDGMLTRIVLVPEENLGIVMLTNSISALTIGLEYYILDQYFDGKSYDWCNIYFRNARAYLEKEDSNWKDYVDRAERNIGPSLKLKKYEGLYTCDLYGDVEIRTENGGLLLDFLPSERMKGELEVFSGDTFLIDLKDFPFLPQGTVRFGIADGDHVEGMEIDIRNPDFDFTELDLKKVKK